MHSHHLRRRRRPRHKQGRGQVLVLACVTFLMMALMMMASFSLANAIHERMRIQAAADAQAFSLAILEARAFNTMAYMNRAIAGGMVAEMGLHAWMAIALGDVSMMTAGSSCFSQIARQEAAWCHKNNIHCFHTRLASQIASNYSSAAGSLSGQLNQGQWRAAIAGINEMMKEIHLGQREILKKTRAELSERSGTLQNLLRKTAPQAEYSSRLRNLTVSEFACALEGSDFDSACRPPPWKAGASVLSAAERARVMESAAMAARPPFQAGRLATGRNVANRAFNNGALTSRTITNPSRAMGIQGSGSFVMTVGGNLEAGVGNSSVWADVKTASVKVSWMDGKGSSQSSGSISSGSPYVGVPCNGDNCFINFRQNSGGGENDYGQPVTYGGVIQDLRLTRNDTERPWELEAEGDVSIELVRGEPAEFRFVPDDWGFAVAKGKTYFHQLGANGWQVPPNMFDPFWRAKLHPFERDELVEVLGKIGDADGQRIADDGQTAVEGVIK